MREIKFRAYIKKENKRVPSETNKIVEVKSLHLGSKKAIIGYSKSSTNYGNYSISFDEIDLIQYTGLKDKNGKEIYEGDILRNIYYKYSNDEVNNKGFKEEILKVVYRGCGFIFEKIKINEIEMPEDFREEFIEVIGNIYENPELLEN